MNRASALAVACEGLLDLARGEFFVEKAVRLLSVTLLLGILISAMACGGRRNTVPQSGSVSGNWEITLNGATPPALVFTGFLNQSGSSVTGSLILPSNCPGVGPVTGSVDGQKLSLNIDQFGDAISLTGTTSGGTFTSQPGACLSPASGTWSAVRVAPISGSFHGSFTSQSGNGTTTVTGTLNQQPNAENSTATLSGTLTTPGSASFCTYVLPGNIAGLISGTQVELILYGQNGSPYAQLGTVGIIGGVTVTPDGTTVNGAYLLPPTSNSCPIDRGIFQLSFP